MFYDIDNQTDTLVKRVTESGTYLFRTDADLDGVYAVIFLYTGFVYKIFRTRSSIKRVQKFAVTEIAKLL